MKRSPRRSGWVVWKSENGVGDGKTPGRNWTLLECTEPRRLRRRRFATRCEMLPGRCSPGKFTAEQVTQILAVACEPPATEIPGRPITHWTHAELRDEVVKRGIVTEHLGVASGSAICGSKQLPCSRTAARCGSHTTEKNPETFQRQVGERSARRIKDARRVVMRNTARARSVWMRWTGLQASGTCGASDKNARVGAVAKHEFEYTRHGTTTVIGNWDVVQGQMFAETIGPTRH